MSRPLKLKVTGGVLTSAFQLPDCVDRGSFAGAYRGHGPSGMRPMCHASDPRAQAHQKLAELRAVYEASLVNLAPSACDRLKLWTRASLGRILDVLGERPHDQAQSKSAGSKVLIC